MSYKRKQTSDTSPFSSKRICRTSTTYATGAGSIPLDDALDDSDLDVEDCSESLQYLGTVRDQAKGIPWFLGAPDAERPLLSDPSHPAQDENGGHFTSGVYIAGTIIGPALPPTQEQYFGEALVTAYESEDEDGEIDGEFYDEDDDDSDLVVDINESKLQDESGRGAYYNGVAPMQDRARAVTSASLKPPRDAYRDALKARFKRLRAALRCKNSTAKGSTYSGIRGGKEERVWRDRICRTRPDPRRLQAMSETTVLNLVRILPPLLKRKLFLESAERAINVSAWTWTLLAKTSEVDEIAYDDVSTLRELGKKAQDMAYTLLKSQATQPGDNALHIEESDDDFLEEEVNDAALDHSIESNEDDDALSDPVSDEELSSQSSRSSRRMRNTSSPLMSPRLKPAASAVSPAPTNSDELEQRRERILAAIDVEEEETASQEDFVALLDMILTVVGEYYGQRDLLNARDELWSSLG